LRLPLDRPPLDQQRPSRCSQRQGILNLGRELRLYLRDRNKARKRTLGPGEFYCLACRAPRRAAGAIADFQHASAGARTLTAICDACDRMICLKVSAGRLDVVAVGIEVMVKPLPASVADLCTGWGIPRDWQVDIDGKRRN
jgi:hypothetical protein